MMLKFFNTLTRKKEEFKPIHRDWVGVYSCGPTVYNYAHIGNMRTFIFADILKRTLLSSEFNVKHIMNITDVGHLSGDRDMGEDKLLTAAVKERKTAWELASFYTDAFLEDMKRLNIILPDKLPKATDHIKDMITLVSELDKKGFTYRTSDGIYFDSSKLSDYGKLAQLDIEGLREGARVEINNEKHNPTDFALWKFSKPKEKKDMEWSSPWGVGFPGWHIECSAMSAKYLGVPFDIHTGGIDFISLHHTNEIAQTEAAFGKPEANLWMHSDFVMVNETRMGKSEGNLLTLQELIDKRYNPLAYRYFVLQGHYRTKLNFSFEALEGAQNTLENLYDAIAEYGEAKIGCVEFEEQFWRALGDDLDTPKALAVMWDLVGSNYPGEAKLQSLLEFDKVLGLSMRTVWEEAQKALPEEVEELIREREVLRKEGSWVKADKLRKQIEGLGFELEDAETKTKVKKKRV